MGEQNIKKYVYYRRKYESVMNHSFPAVKNFSVRDDEYD